MLIWLFFLMVSLNISAADEVDIDEFTLVDKSPDDFMLLIDRAKKSSMRYKNSFVYDDTDSYIKRFGGEELRVCFSEIDSEDFLDYFKVLAALPFLSDAQKLKCSYVLIPYWQKLQLDKNEEHKDEVLQKMFRNNIDSKPSYPIGRLMYAAALHAGADPNVELCKDSHTKLLKISLMYKDCALTELLLQKGADPNEPIKTNTVVSGGVRRGEKEVFPLKCVETLKELQLLLQYGAHLFMQDRQFDAFDSLCALSLNEHDPSILAAYLNKLLKEVEGIKDADLKWYKRLKERLHYVILNCYRINDKCTKEVYINIVKQALEEHIATPAKTVTWHESVTG
ncbi:MAG: hypothetical protein WD055_03215 [Candidatus Dependentiae bacterium]